MPHSWARLKVQRSRTPVAPLIRSVALNFASGPPARKCRVPHANTSPSDQWLSCLAAARPARRPSPAGRCSAAAAVSLRVGHPHADERAADATRPEGVGIRGCAAGADRVRVPGRLPVCASTLTFGVVHYIGSARLQELQRKARHTLHSRTSPLLYCGPGHDQATWALIGLATAESGRCCAHGSLDFIRYRSQQRLCRPAGANISIAGTMVPLGADPAIALQYVFQLNAVIGECCCPFGCPQHTPSATERSLNDDSRRHHPTSCASC